MDYFDLDSLKLFGEAIGEEYDSNSSATKWYYDTREKLKYLVQLLSKDLNEEFDISYSEKPNKQAGQGMGFVLKEYVLIGFRPRRHIQVKKGIFIKPSFFVFKDGNASFSIDIDVNFKDDKNPYNVDRDKLQKQTSWEVKVDDSFPKNWNDLIILIKPVVKKILPILDDYLREKNLEIISENMTSNNDFFVSSIQFPLNQILFGPPGTGKTYNTINYAINIIEPDFLKTNRTRGEIREAFERLCQEERIYFTTFHQSMAYEDFIEGIKPLKPNKVGQVGYEVQNGIFKQVSRKALFSLLPTDSLADQNETVSFENIYSAYLKSLEPLTGKNDYIFQTFSKKNDIRFIELKGTSIIVKFRWSDIEKTKEATQPFSVTKEKIRLLFEAGMDPGKITSLKRDFEPFFKNNLSVYFAVYSHFVQFAKNFTGKKSIDEVESTETLGYEELIDSYNLLPQAKKELKTETPRFVLIIDEINRGNVSQIFGELITLIEEDKRLGKPESLEITLPYSKRRFAVPPNLYIIGTMNTADRSVEALDTALRRRFHFKEMPPQPALLNPYNQLGKLWAETWEEEDTQEFWNSFNIREKQITDLPNFEINREAYIGLSQQWSNDQLANWLALGDYSAEFKSCIIEGPYGIRLDHLLATINKRIEKLLDRDHQIGHSYFMSVYNLNDLKSVFQNKIIPLLQEYFFGDYSKIGLVLGKGFVKEKTWNKENDAFADFDAESVSDFNERTVYQIVDYEKDSLGYFIKIKDVEIQMDFEKAIKLLMNYPIV